MQLQTAVPQRWPAVFRFAPLLLPFILIGLCWRAMGSSPDARQFDLSVPAISAAPAPSLTSRRALKAPAAAATIDAGTVAALRQGGVQADVDSRGDADADHTTADPPADATAPTPEAAVEAEPAQPASDATAQAPAEATKLAAAAAASPAPAKTAEATAAVSDADMDAEVAVLLAANGDTDDSAETPAADTADAIGFLPITGGGATADMRKCLQEDGAERAFTVEDFLAARPTRLRLELLLQSGVPRPATAVTMLATATSGRMHMLEGLCQSWRSVLSVSVYVGVLEGAPDAAAAVANATAAVQAEFDKLEALQACQMDISLYSEIVADAAVQMLFPVNALRNQALLMARTELVAMGEADLLAGSELADIAASRQAYREVLHMTAGNKAVVIPAFETDKWNVAIDAAAGGKSAVKKLWQAKKIRHFLQGGFNPAHADTDFPHWLETEQPYPLSNTSMAFEPWWIARRDAIGPYDVRYRGYGKNKVQHLRMLLDSLGFSYVVHPRAYLVHRPHPASDAKKRFVGELDAFKAGGAAAAAAAPRAAAAAFPSFSLSGRTDCWFSAQRSAGSAYRVLVAPGWARCRGRLPWWQVFPPEGEPMKTVGSVENE